MSAKTCFLIAPIGMAGSEVRKRSDFLLEYVIIPATQRSGYEVLRADQIAAPGLITSQIMHHILESPLAIADLSGLNPNVMYELAIRHAVKKPVIQITTTGSPLPFDIAAMRTIIVDVNDIDSLRRAELELSKTIQAIDSGAEFAETPISAALDVRSFQSISQKEIAAEDSQQFGAFVNVLKDIESRLKAVENNLNRSVRVQDNVKEYSRRIFIVHGHDGELKNELARLLEKLDFEPIILHEQPDKGQTIFAKLNGEMADVGFAFIILTPDDVGALADEPSDLKPRARQNVVFEHGLFAGYLKPERVCAIRRGDVETPSDLHGVLYKTIFTGGSIRSIALEIANELRAAGYIVDANKLLTI